MRRLIYSLIIALCISFAFSAGKPCCNKKTGKNAIACKFNHTNIAKEKDTSEKLISKGKNDDISTSCKSNRANKSKCAKSCGKKPWWKFWEKKSNCACKQKVAIEDASG